MVNWSKMCCRQGQATRSEQFQFVINILHSQLFLTNDFFAAANAVSVHKSEEHFSVKFWSRYAYLSRCSSLIGRVGGRQYLSMAYCMGPPSAKHELMHALGFYHEHSRPDRDKYVTIHWSNILSGKKVLLFILIFMSVFCTVIIHSPCSTCSTEDVL